MTQIKNNQESYDQLILDHYKKVARNNGLSSTSTMEDPYIRQSEIDFFLSSLREESTRRGRPLRVFDIGCGNGHLLQTIAQRFPEFTLFGLEFTPELYEQALSRKIPQLTLRNGDARLYEDFYEDIDVVMTERMVINILNKDHQLIVMKNIFKALVSDGLLLMSESFAEPLAELNEARTEMCLDPIDESYQNLYLDESLIEHALSWGMEEEEGTLPSNYLSTQFFVTRILHKSLRPEKGKVKFSRFAKFFTEALPPAVGNYSPILFRAFRKVGA